jgi:hypothetical protein
MAKHVGMDREGKVRRYAGALNHPEEPCRGYRSVGLRDEDVRAWALERTEGTELGAVEGMNALNPSFRSVDVQAAMAKVNLRPSEGA